LPDSVEHTISLRDDRLPSIGRSRARFQIAP
jgi:hypothetical protein